MSKATPRPWMIDSGLGGNTIKIRNASEWPHNSICELLHSIELKQANAELIVRAVNCHDPAVALLKGVVADYEGDTNIGFDQRIIDIKNFLENLK